MKKQDKNPIDSFFKENTEQHFPYDPSLWKEADRGIAAIFGRRRLYILTALLLLFISSVAVFFTFDKESKAGKISMTRDTGKKVVPKKATADKMIVYANSSDEDPVKTDAGSSAEVTVADNPDKTPESSKQKSNPGNQTGKQSGQSDDSGDEGFKETKENTTDPEPLLSASKDGDPNILTKEKNKYNDLLLFSKQFYAFGFDLSNNKVETIDKLKIHQRKFSIEFEKHNPGFLDHQLGGLSQKQTEYRNKSEKVLNSEGYSLNVMLQQGGFGLITGLGYYSAAIKTDYMFTSNSVVLSELKYKMIIAKIPYEGGTYSLIKEYRDTLAKKSEEKAVEGQVPKNTFQWLQVPLKISYQYPLYRLRFSARLGTDLMWLYKTKGSFIDAGLTSLNTDEKLNNFNISASGQFMAGYQLNHNIQVGGSAYFNQQLRSNFVNYNSRFGSKGFGFYVRWSL